MCIDVKPIDDPHIAALKRAMEQHTQLQPSIEQLRREVQSLKDQIEIARLKQERDQLLAEIQRIKG